MVRVILQYWMLFLKFRMAYWRTPSYNWTRMLTTTLAGLFYGSCYYQQGMLLCISCVGLSLVGKSECPRIPSSLMLSLCGMDVHT